MRTIVKYSVQDRLSDTLVSLHPIEDQGYLFFTTFSIDDPASRYTPKHISTPDWLETLIESFWLKTLTIADGTNMRTSAERKRDHHHENFPPKCTS